MDINITDGEVYIPPVGGNETVVKPVTFTLQYLTVEDQTEVEYFEFIQSKNNRINAKMNNRDIFRRSVLKIENLSVNGKIITTVEDYLNIRGSKLLAEMLADVAVHVYKAMSVDIKN